MQISKAGDTGFYGPQMMATLLNRVANSYGITDVYCPLKRVCRLLIDTSLRAFPERRLFDRQ